MAVAGDPHLEIQQGQLARLGTITNLLGTQSARSAIEKYSGEPHKFLSWIRSLEKYSLVVGTDKETLKGFALQSSEGPVSDFLVRYLNAHAGSSECTWDVVYGELKARFGEIIDTQHAMQILRSSKQRSGETVQVYAERLLRLAEQAWPEMDLTQALIERQIIDSFTDGLTDNAVARKVLREGPTAFAVAVRIAIQEQNLTRKFELRNRGTPKYKQPPRFREKEQKRDEVRHEEPMEIDNFHGKCYKCGKKGHRAVGCRSRKLYEVTTSRLVCYKCGQPGHGIPTCNNVGNPSTGRCWKCGHKGHKQAECSFRQMTTNKTKEVTEHQASLNN